jgi:hypothetical protein
VVVRWVRSGALRAKEREWGGRAGKRYRVSMDALRSFIARWGRTARGAAKIAKRAGAIADAMGCEMDSRTSSETSPTPASSPSPPATTANPADDTHDP